MENKPNPPKIKWLETRIVIVYMFGIPLHKTSIDAQATM